MADAGQDPITDFDKEITAISEVAKIIGGLDREVQGRVIRYVVERFEISGFVKTAAKTSVATQAAPEIEEPLRFTSDFEDFASLVDAARPGTDVMRALIAGYWLQVCKGAPTFDAQSANTELKHLGHASSNITSALSALISQKPAFVLQLRKSGNTRQARKLYKVTEAGIRKVKQMMSGGGDAE
jgi:hypothetical protein